MGYGTDAAGFEVVSCPDRIEGLRMRLGVRQDKALLTLTAEVEQAAVKESQIMPLVCAVPRTSIHLQFLIASSK